MSIEIIKPGPTINESAVNDLEKVLGDSLPSEYREFLLEFNGGEAETNVFPVKEFGNGGVIGFFGIRYANEARDLVAERDRMAGRVPFDFLPIAEAEGGNLVCLSLQDQDRGAVYFWDHEEEAEENEEPTCRNLYVVGNSFKEFWNSLQKFDPSKLELKEGQVKEVWIDPDFLKELGRDSK